MFDRMFNYPISIDVAATIQSTTEPSFKPSEDPLFNPSDKTKERINELGLNILLTRISVSQSLKILEAKTAELASRVKNRTLGYTKKDFTNALNFLEVFSFYMAQSKVDGKKSNLDANKTLIKAVAKAVKEIEFIKSFLEHSPNKVGKGIIKQHVTRLNNLINKILIDSSLFEQIALTRTIEKSQEILKKIPKQILPIHPF